MLKNFEDAQSEISDIGIREAFIDGFRLGARLMLAALSEDDGRTAVADLESAKFDTEK